MRETSSNYSKQILQTNMQDQGGEKKVMKKALSLTLAASLLGGAFAGIAGAADLTVEDQFKALYDAQIFSGIDSKGTPGLDQNMTRAEMAVIISKLKGLTQNAAGQSFADVKATDWYAGWIGAATKANLFAGKGDNKFDPKGTVTIEEIAVVVAKAFGLTESTTAVDGKVDDWAKGWVAAAVGANLLPKFSDYTTVADRGDLVSATYAVYQSSQKVSVVSAKATGAKTVTVVLSRPVDTAKATLSLKKELAAVATTAKWSDDKTTATLTLTNTTIGDGNYSVTLGGVDSIGTAAASFVGEAEKVASIEFLGGETLANSSKSLIDLAAKNQYGENTTLSDFTAYVLGTTPTVSKNDDGTFHIELDFTTKTGPFTGLTPGVSIIPVVVYANDSHINVTKNFTLGTVPFLSKVVLGDVTYPTGQTSLSGSADQATISAKFFDQYGNRVNPKLISSAVGAEISRSTIQANVLPFDTNVTAALNSDNDTITVTLTNGAAKNADYNLTVYAGTGNATAKVSVQAAAIPAKVAFGTFDGTLAAGDKSVVLPLVVTDANGNTLTGQQIVDNGGDIKFTATNSDTATPHTAGYEIIKAGTDKGKLKVYLTGTAARSSVYVTASIATSYAQSFAQTSITVQPQRVPASIAVVTNSADKGILKATSTLELKLVDQYGSDFDSQLKTNPVDGNNVPYIYQLVFDNATKSGDTSVVIPAATVAQADFDTFNDFDFIFSSSSNAKGSTTLKVSLQKKRADGTNFSEVANYSRTYSQVDQSTSLTYSLAAVGDLYAVGDAASAGLLTVNDATIGQLDKGLSVTAKDSSGATVKLPNNMLSDVVSSDPSVVAVNPDATIAAVNATVYGKTAGTATVTASIYTNKGEYLTFNVPVTVKKDLVTVQTLTADNSSAAYNSAKVAAQLMGLKAVDQYGIEYYGATVVTYDKLLNIRYSVTGKVGTGSITISSTGTITIAGDVTEFTLTATAPNGKTVSTLITN
ncbi:S-layer homology domain-containing protein [Gorillibacterium massiliense]|uniref:S-layer homology domain-containing protein n=1 Tax=Gorillibacterium massiliense TaxID=1280390 RepID=UPI0004AC706E|nr:S-layer homology domain-containing protein [Gorillibacterium massiliense]